MQHAVDDERTRLYNCPNVVVLYGKGNDADYYIELKQSTVTRCPLCQRDKVLNNGYTTRTFNDYIELPNGKQKFITVHLRLRKFLCASSSCKHAFAEPTPFLKKGARNSVRMEELIIHTCMYKQFVGVPLYTGGAVSHTGAKKIFQRWIQEKEEQRAIHRLPIIGIHSHEMGNAYRFFITGLDDDMDYLLDVLPDTSYTSLKKAFDYIDTNLIQYVIIDMTESSYSFVRENIPQATPIIQSECVLRTAREYIRDSRSETLAQNGSDISRSLRELLRADHFDVASWCSTVSDKYPEFAPFAASVALFATAIYSGIRYRSITPSYYNDDLDYFFSLAMKTYGCSFEFVRARLMYQVSEAVEAASTEREPLTMSLAYSFSKFSIFTPPAEKNITPGIPLRSLIKRLEIEDKKMTQGE